MTGLTFCPDKHEYRLDGVPVPSVTTIIRSVLPGWNAGPYYLQKGRELHAACQALDEGKVEMWEDVPHKIRGRVMAWNKFKTECPLVITQIETPLVSKKFRFAGTCDRLFSGCIVCDIKSTIEPSVVVQISGYSLLWRETGINPKRGMAVELRDDGTYRVKWIEKRELLLGEQTFLSCLSIYNFKSQHGMLPKEASS